MENDYLEKISPLVPLTTPVLESLGITNFDKKQVRQWRKQHKEEDFPELKNKAYL